MPTLTDHPPQTAIFLAYAAIVLGILIVAGIALPVLTFVLHRPVRGVWAIYVSWLVLAPLAFGCIYLGRWPAILFFLLLALLGFREFARATGLSRDGPMTLAGYLLVLAAGGAALARNPVDASPGWFGLYMALPACAVGVFAIVPILRNGAQGQLQIIALAVLGFMCCGWMFLHVALLADMPGGMGYLLYLVLAVELNDVAAFTCGTLLGRPGKHLLRSRISPGKTWEGAGGALAFTIILTWLLRFTFPRFGPMRLLVAALVVSIGGQLGDLSMSVIKRDLGVKDMGRLIPGHGGVLDRIDSLIFAGPLFVHLIRILDRHG
jgi:phosphatidate cytidylyltransferase